MMKQILTCASVWFRCEQPSDPSYRDDPSRVTGDGKHTIVGSHTSGNYGFPILFRIDLFTQEVDFFSGSNSNYLFQICRQSLVERENQIEMCRFTNNCTSEDFVPDFGADARGLTADFRSK